MPKPWERDWSTAKPWERDWNDEESSALAFLNRGIANTLGLAVDIPTAALNLGMAGGEKAREALGMEPSGVEPFTEPFGGGQSIESGMRALGVPVPRKGEEARSVGAHVARGTGEAAGALLPFGLAARGMQAYGGPLASRIGQTVTETAVRHPALTMATETAAGAGAGFGGYAAKEQFPDQPWAEALGELAGGLSVAAGPAAVAGAVRRAPLAGTLLRAGKAAVVPFTRAGGEVRAARRVQDLARDPEAAASMLREDVVSDLTPAQRTGEPRLLALERAVRDQDAGLEGAFTEQEGRATGQLTDALRGLGGGDAGDTRGFFGRRRDQIIADLEAQEQRRLAGIEAARERQVAGAERRRDETIGEAERRRQATTGAAKERGDRLRAALDERARQAAQRAQGRLALLRPDQRMEEASAIVRDEIEKALTDMRARERELWTFVPKRAPLKTDTARAAYDDLVEATPRAQADDIPDIARRFLDRESNSFLGEESTVNEVWGLRSKLLEAARTARAQGQFNTARIADDLADALLEDLGAARNNVRGEPGERLRAALDFSADLSARFKQGAVGRLLRREATGEARVDPRLTLETSIGRGGVRGDVAAGDILEAAPAAREGIGQYMLNRFQQSAVRNGRLTPQGARDFVSANEALLDRYPGLRQRILDAAAAEEAAERAARAVQTRGPRIASAVDRTQREASAAAREATRKANRLATETLREIERAAANEGNRARRVAARRIKALRSPEKSATARFLDAPVDEEFARILKARNPGRVAFNLRAQAAKDKTGRASRGLKTAALDYLINKAGTRRFDDYGQELLSGRALQAALNDKRTAAAINQILSPAEQKRLARIATELQRMETSAGRLPDIGGIITDTPSTLLSLLARTMAARSGAKAGAGTSGASLLTAHFFSRRAQALLERLTTDTAKELLIEAVKDPALMRALLTRTATPKGQAAAAQRLNAWVAGPGSHTVSVLVGDDGYDR